MAHIPHQQIFLYGSLISHSTGYWQTKSWFTNWTQTFRWIRIFSLASPSKPIYLWPGTFRRWQWPTNWKRTFVVSYISMAVKITHIFLPWFFCNWRRGVLSSRESEFLTFYNNNECKTKRCLILLHIFGFRWAKSKNKAMQEIRYCCCSYLLSKSFKCFKISTPHWYAKLAKLMKACNRRKSNYLYSFLENVL